MKKTVQDFVENYNKCMDWNIELRKRLRTELFSDHETTAEILDSYLSDKKITPENYELSNTVLYECAPNHYEMHVYSYLTYHDSYFWTTFGMTKEEYIADRIRVIKKELLRELDDTNSKLDILVLKKEKLGQFANSINNLQEMENVRETREMITYIKGQKYKVVADMTVEECRGALEKLLRCWNTYNAATTFLTGMMDMHSAANPKTRLRSVSTEEVPAEIARSINLLRTSFILNLTEYMLMIAPEWMEYGVGFLDFDPPMMQEMKVWKYDKFGTLLSDEPYLLKLR